MKLKKLLLFSNLVCFSFITRAQVNMDSLLTVWNDKAQPDTNRLKAIQDIAYGGYSSSNPDSSYYFAQLQFDFAKRTGHKKGMALALATQAFSLRNKGKFDEALDHYFQSIKFDEEIGNNFGVATNLTGVGLCYYIKGDHVKALEYYFKSLKISEKFKYNDILAAALKPVGDIYKEQGDFDKALDYLRRSLKIFKETGNIKGQGGVLNTIATIYRQQGNYSRALEMYTQNLAGCVKRGDKINGAGTLLNMGSIYELQGDTTKALENYMEALKSFEEMGVTRGVSLASMGIAQIYLELGNYALALKYNDKGFKLSEKTGNKGRIATAQRIFSMIYTAQGDHAKAISMGTKALNIFKVMADLEQTQGVAENLVTSYKAIGNYRKALEMTNLYMAMRDSLSSKANQKAVIKNQLQYQFEKQKAIDDLENEKRVDIETQKKENQQKLTIAITAILVLTLLLALGLGNRNRYIKKTHAALAAAKNRAEQSEKYKEQFLANMSHEIRTPMHAISGMVNILERKEHLPAQEKYLDAMHKSSDNLLVILNDVLDMAKIEAGKLHIENKAMSPASVLQQVTEILKYKAEEKGLSLAYTVGDDVPALVMGDPNRLNQVLVNLVGNAIKFTKKGSVDISLTKEGGQLKFSIKDTGVGIPKDKLKNIFEAFEQVIGSAARRYGGTGLGLSISRQLVELQHGKIWVETEEGRGSIFYVELPVVAVTKEAVSKDIIITKEKLGEMAASLKGIRILLAEDNAFNRMIALDDLSFYIEDVKIDTVENGALAIDHFKNGEYNLILMDAQMPVMNGFDATRQIRELEKAAGKSTAIPVVAMTSSLLKTEIESCFAAGMNNYIPKPYKPEELIGRIYNTVNKNSTDNS